MKKQPKELNGKTPLWFKMWHLEYHLPTVARSKRNEKLIYLVLAAIIGTSILGKEYVPEITAFIKSLLELL